MGIPWEKWESRFPIPIADLYYCGTTTSVALQRIYTGVDERSTPNEVYQLLHSSVVLHSTLCSLAALHLGLTDSLQLVYQFLHSSVAPHSTLA